MKHFRLKQMQLEGKVLGVLPPVMKSDHKRSLETHLSHMEMTAHLADLLLLDHWELMLISDLNRNQIRVNIKSYFLPIAILTSIVGGN